MFNQLFRGRHLWRTLGVVLIALVFARLGIWQLDRLAQRRAINTAIQSRMAEPPAALTPELAQASGQEYRRVALRGTYDASQELVLRNRTLEGAPGVHVLTPLRYAGPDGAPLAVLVDRGWLPLSQSGAEQRQAYAAPAGEVQLLGQIRRSQEDFGGPDDPPFTAERLRLDAWFHVDIPRIGQQTGYPLLPVFVEQLPAPGDPALPKPDPLADLGEGPHLGYAIQWFAFALIALVGYITFSYQQARKRM